MYWYLLFSLQSSLKSRGTYVGSQNWYCRRSDRSGRPVRPVWCCAVRVELGFELWNPFVTQFGRDMSSSAYKYKGHGRLRSFYPTNQSIYYFFYFSPNPSFSNLVLFFASLDGVQGRLGWPADLKTTLDLRAPNRSDRLA